MSNAWLNIRFGNYHVIIGERWALSCRVSRNAYHEANSKRFEVYTLKPFVY